MKQACRDELVVYSLCFSPTTYTSLYSYVLSTVLRKSNLTLHIFIYIFIYDVVKSKRRHWLAVTLSFKPCGDCQTDFYFILLE